MTVLQEAILIITIFGLWCLLLSLYYIKDE
jgi:hypothetical protein